IYVGKAKNLKNRVSQYFRNQKDRAPKVKEMIRNIHTLEYQVTDTELDAFIEECRLIKKIKPKYNKQMKNSNNYLYIKVPSELYPKVTIVKERVNDGALYFGPFTSRNRVETTVEYLYEFYPVRKCASPGYSKRANGCLFQQLGSCLGVCTGQINPDEYWIHIRKIQLLLSGKDMAVVQELSKRVNLEIEKLQFEKAALYREYYLGLKHVIGKQALVKSSTKQRNILAIEFINTGLAKLFLIKGNRLIDREVIKIEAEESKDLRHHIKQLIRDKLVTKECHKRNLSQNDIDEAQIIYSYLKKNKKIISFSIALTCLNDDMSLDAKVNQIVNRITLGNLSQHSTNITVP
ncbi:MAG: GIY-YIG nuclease family protein, partial [Bacillota bacterium]|nr:GIY-YIG nuclease family protein [Bacillota bacterium]